MAAKTSLDRKAPHGKETVKVESASRPGRVHTVDPERGYCSCKATVLCRHIRQARIRQAKATKRCRSCAGYGAFHWGERKVADCHPCFGTGRAA